MSEKRARRDRHDAARAAIFVKRRALCVHRAQELVVNAFRGHEHQGDIERFFPRQNVFFGDGLGVQAHSMRIILAAFLALIYETAFWALVAIVPTEAMPLCTCWLTCPSCAVNDCASWLICAAVACDCAASKDCISLRSASPSAEATPRALSATKIPKAPRIAMTAAALHPIMACYFIANLARRKYLMAFGARQSPLLLLPWGRIDCTESEERCA